MGTTLVFACGSAPVLPEINALQSAMRKRSGDYVREAEKFGHSEDVCTYVKCDIGMLKKGNIGPTGETLPPIAKRRGDFEDWFVRGLALDGDEAKVVAVYEDEPLPADHPLYHCHNDINYVEYTPRVREDYGPFDTPELEGVTIAGDDDDIPTLCPRRRRQSGDHVVCLHPGDR